MPEVTRDAQYVIAACVPATSFSGEMRSAVKIDFNQSSLSRAKTRTQPENLDLYPKLKGLYPELQSLYPELQGLKNSRTMFVPC